MENSDVIVLGAGASGLMCAAEAAGRGRKVLLLESGPQPGRKLLLSGGGNCNVTNRQVTADNYVGANNKFCVSALKRFTPAMLLERLEKGGIALEEREYGQIFCRRSAKDVLDFLLENCRLNGCRLLTGVTDMQVEKIDGLFRVSGSRGIFSAQSLVIATGGPACPQCGASSQGMHWAKLFGHRIIPAAPALVPLIMPQEWPLHGLAGISVPVEASLAADQSGRPSGKKMPALPSFTLPLLFTHKGASGPAILQISSYWQRNCRLILNFLPGRNLPELLSAPGTGKMLLRNALSRHLPERLAVALLPPDLGGRKVAELSRRELEAVAKAVQAHSVQPGASEGLRRAEASRGGVDTAEVSSASLQSKLLEGLFFCGEVLDVCGQLGGYNLHWAWASGYAAGNAV